MRSRSTPRILTSVACIATSVVGAAGCGDIFRAPRFSLEAGNVKITDSRDTDLTLEDADLDLTKKSGHIGKLVIRDNASDVIKQNIQLAGQFIELQKVYGANAIGIISRLESLAAKLEPMLSAAIAANHEEAMQPPPLVQLLDSSGRLIGYVRNPAIPPAPATAEAVTPQPKASAREGIDGRDEEN